MTYKEFIELAYKYYNKGGDVVVECWDEMSFRFYVEEFGPMSKNKALGLFSLYDSTAKDYQATAW